MIELDPFPDVEVVLVAMLTDLAPTGTRTPEDLGAGTPRFISVVRAGGGDDGITDRPVVAVTTFGTDRQDSWELTRAVQQRVLAAPATQVAGVLIDKTSTFTGPIEVPDQNTDVRVVPTYYQIEYRRPR